jgi:WD40 repeat protein
MVGTPARVWDTATGEVVFTAPRTADCGQAVAFDPDGRYLAVQTSITDGPNVHVWDLETGEAVFEAHHEPQWLGGLAFSPDGGLLLTAGSDGTGRLWEIATGEPVRTLKGHTGPVEDAAFDRVGERIVTGGADGTVRVWDAATGEQQLVLRCQDGWVEHVAFDPTRDWIHARCQTLTTEHAWASVRSSVQAWTLDLEELVAIAESRVTRTLNEEECTAYNFEECPAQS